MLLDLIKKLSLYLLLPVFIVLVGILSVTITTQGLANNIELTLIENFGLYLNLLNTNAVMATKLALIDNPLILIERLDEQKINQIWGFYIMPVNAVALLLVSIFIIHIRRLKLSTCKWLVIWGGVFTIMFSIFYLRLQTCCTTEPTWLLEIWLFSQTSEPLADTAFWKDIYVQLIGRFIYIQFSIAALGGFIIYIASYSQHLCKDKQPQPPN